MGHRYKAPAFFQVIEKELIWGVCTTTQASLTAAVRVPELNVPFFMRARNNKVQRSKQRALLTQQFDPFFLQRRAGL